MTQLASQYAAEIWEAGKPPQTGFPAWAIFCRLTWLPQP
jgi:hypothetical protein